MEGYNIEKLNNALSELGSRFVRISFERPEDSDIISEFIDELRNEPNNKHRIAMVEDSAEKITVINFSKDKKGTIELAFGIGGYKVSKIIVDVNEENGLKIWQILRSLSDEGQLTTMLGEKVTFSDDGSLKMPSQAKEDNSKLKEIVNGEPKQNVIE